MGRGDEPSAGVLPMVLAAAAAGVLDETHWVELKQAVPAASKPANLELAKDLGNLPPKPDYFATDEAASYPRSASLVDPNNPPWPAYRGYHEYSFAHETMGKRLPTILGKAIEDVYKTLNQEWREEVIVDLLQCIERMTGLMRELQANEKLRPIVDDNEGDVTLWNKAIAR